MPTFRKGDRVRVEFEAVVTEPVDEDDDVRLQGDATTQYGSWVKASALTLVEPEYEEGEMYVDADGDFFYYSRALGTEGAPWFAPGDQDGHRRTFPTAPLRKLVPESA